MSRKSPGYRQVEWTSGWEHPLEFWLVRNAPIIEDARASDDRERQRQMDTAKRDERAREVLRQGTALFGERPQSRLCPCGCGVTLMRGMTGHPEVGEEYEQEWEWIHQCARGDADDFAQVPVEPPRLRDAVSQAQIRWARDMIAQFPRKPKEQIERENHITWAQLEHFAKTPLEGLPERSMKKAKEQAKPEVKKPAKPKSSPKRKAKEA
jgi:hypothetical protein